MLCWRKNLKMKENGRLSINKSKASQESKNIKKFKCPSCGEVCVVKDVVFGAKYNCSKCGAVIEETF